MIRYNIPQVWQDKLSDAANPNAFLSEGATGTFDVDVRCDAVWIQIGAALGFNPATRQKIAGIGVSAVMADPK